MGEDTMITVDLSPTLDADRDSEDKGRVADLAREISLAEKILKSSSDLPIHLHRTGKLYQALYKITGKLEDISEAISLMQKAVSFAQNDDTSLPSYLTDLGIAFESRFKYTNHVNDLSNSISCRQKAVHLIQDEHTILPTELTTLGALYLQRFQWTEDITNLSEAISCQRKAIFLTPEQNVDMPHLLHALGKLYVTRFECTGSVADLSEVKSSIEKSIRLTPVGDQELPKRLDNLAEAYHSDFKKEGSIVNLYEAISLREKALCLSPDGHADIPVMLYNLGYSYEALYRHTGQRNDLDKAATNYANAAATSTGIPSFKLLASKRLAKIAEDLYPEQAITAYTSAIQLVVQLAGLYETIEMRQNNLRHISDTSTLAAASAFKLGRCDLALEWLEQGRGLGWGQLNCLRSPLDDLRAQHPDIADEIARVASCLETFAYRPHSGDKPEEENLENMKQRYEDKRHTQMAQEWEELLVKVRTLPGFEDFLLPPSCSAMVKHIPKSGVVVLINVHKDRCDAMVLVPDAIQPIHVPLPEFTYSKALSLRDKLRTQLRVFGVRMRDTEPVTRGMRTERNAGLKVILSQLWHWVVKPILDGLGYSEPPSEKKRIWWCTTGPLSFLPVHAAGVYGESGAEIGNTLPEFAISSYTPTVRALLDRLGTAQKFENKNSGLFLVTQPNTPGLPPIPKTTEEAQIIQRLVKENISRVLCLSGASATVDQTVVEMEAHSSVHFACHASQNIEQPLQSALALHDGKLELYSMIQKRLKGADLAFLSACQTSTGDETLPEEAVHLAAGMLAAGYRGVVATMWSIRDSYAPKIVEDFYSYLLERSANFDGEYAAYALHHAIQNLRKRLAAEGLDHESSFLVWIPYVHFGL